MVTASHKLARVREMFTLLTNTTKHVPIYIKRLENKNQNFYGSTQLKSPLFLRPVHCLLECFPKALCLTSSPLREVESPKIPSLYSVTPYCVFVWWTDIAVRTNTPAGFRAPMKLQEDRGTRCREKGSGCLLTLAEHTEVLTCEGKVLKALTTCHSQAMYRHLYHAQEFWLTAGKFYRFRETTFWISWGCFYETH